MDCRRIRPLLDRVVEGEGDPVEAMRVAQHLGRCTACRILQARSRRLARILERGLPDLPVGEEFVRAVMSTLPEGPPPRSRQRGMKLALIAFPLLLGLLVAARGAAAVDGGAPGGFSLPQIGDGTLPGPEESGSLLTAVSALAALPLHGLRSVPLALPLALAGIVAAQALLATGLLLGLGCVVLQRRPGT
ncbi:MAG TPA: zf-HC2 domain-containing protein [Candidatus Polarisedimenticolaceae bacterium]|nr:zf-HC2 domain-containing protein [Candidatus Polarisedimenticolaceae bacterium]